MPRGGKREGAGRKKGAATKKTAKTTALAEEAAGEGALPLEVLLLAMRKAVKDKDWKQAAAVAAQAAPYVHPRKSPERQPDGKDLVVEVRVVRDRNFYGNADRLPAGGAAAPAAGP